jgi:hypothetical protein
MNVWLSQFSVVLHAGRGLPSVKHGTTWVPRWLIKGGMLPSLRTHHRTHFLSIYSISILRRDFPGSS